MNKHSRPACRVGGPARGRCPRLHFRRRPEVERPFTVVFSCAVHRDQNTAAMSRKRSLGSPQPHEASLEPDEQLLCSVSEITEHLSRNITLVLESALSEIRKMVSVRVRVLRAELRQKSDEVELLKARLLEGQRSERRVKPAAAAAPVVKKENIDAICDFLMKDKNQRGSEHEQGEGEGSGDALSLWPDTSGPPDPETETDLFSSILPSASKRMYEYEWMTGVELTSDFKGEAEVKCDEAAEDEQMNHDSDESTLRSVSEHFTDAPTSPAEEQRDSTHTTRADEPFSAHTFICPFCGTLCPTPSFLEEHVKLIHHDQATPSAPPPSSSSSRGQGEAEEAGPRRAREKKVQGGYECGDCGRHFNYLGNLRQHQRIHTGEKPFACPECGERFRHAARLKSHRLSHSGAQSPFPCPQCGKGFPVLSGLKRHQRVHTGESPYACPQCGRRFKELGNLYTHMRIHSGATPYSCYQCGRSFRHLGTFKSHRCTAPPAWPQEDKVQTG